MPTKACSTVCCICRDGWFPPVALDEMLMRFHRWARELGLAGATIRLFPDRWRLGAPSNHTHLALSRQAFEPLRIQRLGQAQHYLYH